MFFKKEVQRKNTIPECVEFFHSASVGCLILVGAFSEKADSLINFVLLKSKQILRSSLRVYRPSLP